jgi:hypothetical protein
MRKGVHPDRVFVWEFPSSQLGGTLATNSGIPPRRLFIWRLQLHGPVNRDNSFNKALIMALINIQNDILRLN